MSGFPVVEKAPSGWQKVFLKKTSQLICKDKSSKRCAEIIKKIIGPRDI